MSATAYTVAATAAARLALLGLSLLAAAFHGAHASLSLSASLVSSQTIDGQWQESGTDRYVCTEANIGTFTCITTRSLSHGANPVITYAGVLARSTSPRTYLAGAQLLNTYPYTTVKLDDATTYRFILAANGTQLSICSPTKYVAGITTKPYACKTWTKMPNPEGFAFSWQDPIPDMFCVSVNEPQDPPWADNYFCSVNDRGLKWSANGPISGMKCTLIDQPNDAEGVAWSNNYICVPSTSSINFVWSRNGSKDVDKESCIVWDEPAEWSTSTSSSAWSYSYLCY